MATPGQALEKLKHYCAYQERSHKEVEEKLHQLKVWGEDADEIISNLIQENFLNEERYAQAYVRGKFNMKKWGRNKIRYALKRNQISDYCIKKGMQEIDEEDYLKTLSVLTRKKYETLKKEQHFRRIQKTRAYLVRKGYEYELITETLTQLSQENP